jgi:hypothetical protein
MIGSLGNMEEVVSFSFIVCQETGSIASASCRAVTTERVRRCFLIANVSADNLTLCLEQRLARELQVGWALMACYKVIQS